MSKNIFVLLAFSRSGKDSLANIILSRTPAINFKWSSFVKSMVEQAYGLHSGDLENPKIKCANVPSTSISYQDVLIDFFHKQGHLADPMFFKRKPLADLEWLMSGGKTIVSTDTRCSVEVAQLKDLVIQYGYKLHLVRLEREGVGYLSSDIDMVENYHRLLRTSTTDYYETITDSPDYLKQLETLASTVLDNADIVTHKRLVYQ